jgi:hypothetical protein
LNRYPLAAQTQSLFTGSQLELINAAVLAMGQRGVD